MCLENKKKSFRKPLENAAGVVSGLCRDRDLSIFKLQNTQGVVENEREVEKEMRKRKWETEKE